MLAATAVIGIAGVGAISFAEAASAATPTLTVTPSSGLQPQGSTTVTVAGSGFTPGALGAVLECNGSGLGTTQPTIMVLGNAVPVSCGPAPGTSTIVTVNASGDVPSTQFTVTTGTVGPPATGTDSSGGDAATDAAKYPCPPTTAQQAAGASCGIVYGDTDGENSTVALSFAAACTVPTTPAGYDLAASDGGVFSFGNLPFCGSAGSLKLNKPVVGLATTANAGGYWLAASDGGVFNYGNAKFFGSAGSL
jgi:hypothetical protein